MASPLVKATNPRDLHNYVLTIKFINKKQHLKFENQSVDIPTALLVTQKGYNFFF